MADFTVITKNEMLDNFGSVTRYLALFDGDPQDTGNELTGDTYARVAIPAGSWRAAVAGQKKNSAKLTFQKAGADWNGGNIIPYFGIMDAETGGNLRMSDAPTVPKTCLNGDTVEFDVDQLVASLT